MKSRFISLLIAFLSATSALGMDAETLSTALRADPENKSLQALAFRMYREILTDILTKRLNERWTYSRCSTTNSSSGNARQYMQDLLQYAWPQDSDFRDVGPGKVTHLSSQIRKCEGKSLAKKGKKTPHSILSFYLPKTDTLYFDFTLPFYEGLFVAIHELSHRLWERSQLRTHVLRGIIFEQTDFVGESTRHSFWPRRFKFNAFSDPPTDSMWSHTPNLEDMFHKKHKVMESVSTIPSMTNEMVATLTASCFYDLLKDTLDSLPEPQKPRVAESWHKASFKKWDNEKALINLSMKLQRTYAPKTRVNFLVLKPMRQIWVLDGLFEAEDKYTFRSVNKMTPWYDAVLDLFFKGGTSSQTLTVSQANELQNELLNRASESHLKSFSEHYARHRHSLNLKSCVPDIDDQNDGEGSPGSEGVHGGHELMSTIHHPHPLSELNP